jgi:hypothetical protein
MSGLVSVPDYPFEASDPNPKWYNETTAHELSEVNIEGRFDRAFYERIHEKLELKNLFFFFTSVIQKANSSL